MKKILLSIVALSALWSCSNKPEGTTPDLTPTQELTVRVTEINQPTTGTRLTEAAAQTGKLTFNSGHIFVINPLGAVEQSVAIDMSVITTTGQVIATKVSSDSRVYILGNISPNVDVNSLTTLDMIEASTLTFAAGEEKDYTKAMMGNATGIPAPIIKDTNDATKATVAVSLSPLYSRIELKEVKGDTNIVSFDVKGVYVDDYYGSFTLTGREAGSIWHQSDSRDFSSNAGVPYPNVGEAGTWSSTGAQGATSAVPAAGQVWAYHVASASVPRFIVMLANIKYKDASGTETTFVGNGDGVAYLTVSTYKNSPIQFERGKVYQVSGLVFGRDNLATSPNPTDVTLTVTANMVDWSMVALDPTIQ